MASVRIPFSARGPMADASGLAAPGCCYSRPASAWASTLSSAPMPIKMVEFGARSRSSSVVATTPSSAVGTGVTRLIAAVWNSVHVVATSVPTTAAFTPSRKAAMILELRRRGISGPSSPTITNAGKKIASAQTAARNSALARPRMPVWLVLPPYSRTLSTAACARPPVVARPPAWYRPRA